jgi:hypothetical protein
MQVHKSVFDSACIAIVLLLGWPVSRVGHVRKQLATLFWVSMSDAVSGSSDAQ